MNPEDGAIASISTARRVRPGMTASETLTAVETI
jgi:hypothetical protein